jgi:hypothetical protein
MNLTTMDPVTTRVRRVSETILKMVQPQFHVRAQLSLT